MTQLPPCSLLQWGGGGQNGNASFKKKKKLLVRFGCVRSQLTRGLLLDRGSIFFPLAITGLFAGVECHVYTQQDHARLVGIIFAEKCRMNILFSTTDLEETNTYIFMNVLVCCSRKR